VNSGCSFRMCLRKKHFEILKQVEVVYLGDGKLCKVLSRYENGLSQVN
jgi:hypothetical protein